MDDSDAVSPPAPALPPRRYRGEVDLTMVDRLPSGHQGVMLASRCMDSTNGESTLPHDTYANQLRRQARRYQQTRGSSFSHPRPLPPDWKPPPPPVLPKDLPPLASTDAPTSTCKSSESGFQKSGYNHVRESEAPQSGIELTSGRNTNESALQKSWAHTSMQEGEIPSADAGLSASWNKISEVQQTAADVSLHSPRNRSFDLNAAAGDVGSSSSGTYGHPVVDVVSGYDRYYSIGDDHPTSSLSRSFSSYIPSDVQSSELSSNRRLSQSAVWLNAQPTRCGLQSTETTCNAKSSAVERSTSSTSVTINNDLRIDQRATLTSTTELPSRRNYLSTEVDVQAETTPSFTDLGSSSNVEAGEQSLPEVIKPSLTELKFFRRQKFPVEIDCTRQAEVLAGLLRRIDRDEALVNVLGPFAGHHTATDFMAKVLGIKDSEHRCYGGLPESLQLRLSARDTCHAALGKMTASVCSTGPAPDTQLTCHSSHSSCSSLEKAKETMMDLLERKLSVLQQQKQLLQQEITDNKELGLKVNTLAEQALQCRERDKFYQYVRDVDKVTSLLLKLSEMLARADNAVTSLPSSASDTERKSLLSRRDDLTQKHEDAALLRCDIERRSQPLLLTLCSALSPTEFTDVEYHALMRTQLAVELQDADAAISLADRQLALLRTSVNGSAEGETEP